MLYNRFSPLPNHEDESAGRYDYRPFRVTFPFVHHSSSFNFFVAEIPESEPCLTDFLFRVCRTLPAGLAVTQ